MMSGSASSGARSFVSVVIPTFNRCEDLRITVEALEKQTYPADRMEVIVIDNGSTDGTEAMIADLQGRLGIAVRYRRKQPEGPGAARNLGAEMARGDYVAFVDSDVSLAPDWLQETAALLDDDGAVGQVGGKVIYDHHRDCLNSYGGVLSPIGLAWDAREGAAAASVDSAEETLWISCSATLVRRSAFDAAGGFDAAFFYAHEDTDLSWRLGVLGWKVLVIPTASVFHRVGEAIGQSSPQIVFHACKNRLRSMLKNMSGRRLAAALPIYLAYALADATLRPPRKAKLVALAWNLRALPGTLRLRRVVQHARRVPDDRLLRLMNPRWFPEVRLAGRRRRPVHAEGSGDSSLSPHVRDDRVA